MHALVYCSPFHIVCHHHRYQEAQTWVHLECISTDSTSPSPSVPMHSVCCPSGLFPLCPDEMHPCSLVPFWSMGRHVDVLLFVEGSCMSMSMIRPSKTKLFSVLQTRTEASNFNAIRPASRYHNGTLILLATLPYIADVIIVFHSVEAPGAASLSAPFFGTRCICLLRGPGPRRPVQPQSVPFAWNHASQSALPASTPYMSPLSVVKEGRVPSASRSFGKRYYSAASSQSSPST